MLIGLSIVVLCSMAGKITADGRGRFAEIQAASAHSAVKFPVWHMLCSGSSSVGIARSYDTVLGT